MTQPLSSSVLGFFYAQLKHSYFKEKAKFIKTINQITTEAGTDAQFECEVEPFNCQVEWYSGNMRLRDSKKFEMSQRGRSLNL